MAWKLFAGGLTAAISTSTSRYNIHLRCNKDRLYNSADPKDRKGNVSKEASVRDNDARREDAALDSMEDDDWGVIGVEETEDSVFIEERKTFEDLSCGCGGREDFLGSC